MPLREVISSQNPLYSTPMTADHFQGSSDWLLLSIHSRIMLAHVQLIPSELSLA